MEQSQLIQLPFRVIRSLWNRSFVPRLLPASFVRIIRDGMLGSPVPIGLVATTRNSYSTQGFRSTAIADSMSPVMTSGTTEKEHISWRSVTNVCWPMMSPSLILSSFCAVISHNMWLWSCFLIVRYYTIHSRYNYYDKMNFQEVSTKYAEVACRSLIFLSSGYQRT